MIIWNRELTLFKSFWLTVFITFHFFRNIKFIWKFSCKQALLRLIYKNIISQPRQNVHLSARRDNWTYCKRSFSTFLTPSLPPSPRLDVSYYRPTLFTLSLVHTNSTDLSWRMWGSCRPCCPCPPPGPSSRRWSRTPTPPTRTGSPGCCTGCRTPRVKIIGFTKFVLKRSS